MKFLFLSLTIISGNSIWAMPKPIVNCQSYLLAPTELKPVTRDLLSPKTGNGVRLNRQQELSGYVAQAPLGSNKLADYLQSLRADTEDSNKNLSESLFAAYLMRPGNQELASQRLPALLKIFWSSFRLTNQGIIQSDPWMENVLTFLAEMLKSHPVAMNHAWTDTLEKSVSQFIDVYDFIQLFHLTADYLRTSSCRGPSQVPQERLKYVAEIIRELDFDPDDTRLENLAKFYYLESNPFQDNETYLLDMKLCAGRDARAISPLRSFVFLFRFAKRMENEFPQSDFKQIERDIREIKELSLKRAELLGGSGT